MKRFTKFLLMTNLLFAGTPVLAQALEAKMTSFKMNVCAPTKECLAVEAASSEGSKVRPLHLLKKPLVTITKGSKKETLTADSGYIDLSENQLVLYKKTAGKLNEISFDLNTLKRLDTPRGEI